MARALTPPLLHKHPDPSLPHARPPEGIPVQLGLDELGTPLHEVTFVVLDLETTGTSPSGAGITEIGAVKVRGGAVLGEFQTLVNPGELIPARITSLTGISNRMVASAPTITAVLPSLWEFLSGSVLVAHNANFDVSFLRAAGKAMDLPWPGLQVVDTLALARRVVSRDEAPNHKLSTLAALFRTQVAPDHRALSDARATVDVLHALLGRLAPWGITHLEDLKTAADPVAPEVRAKRHLADGLPSGPGVYLFHNHDGEVLYVGTSGNIRRRVRSYFTATEKRSKMREMLRMTTRVSAIACATTLEANVRELRMIAAHAPRFNRRAKFPERRPWIRLTDEAHPRLTIVTTMTTRADSEAHIGPFPSRKAATAALEALQASLPIRQCSTKLPLVAKPHARPCALLDMGRCVAPCSAGDDVAGGAVRAQYALDVRSTREAMLTDPSPVVRHFEAKMASLVESNSFEAAAVERDRLVAFLQASDRSQKFAALARCAQLVAAHPAPEGGWQIVVIRHGRLAGTAICPPGADPVLTIEAVVATAEHVDAPNPPMTATHPDESLMLLAWLDMPGVRLVQITHPLTYPVRGAGSYHSLIRNAQTARALDQGDN